jgi:FMN phosphatase YigB (HAD superfamily)
VQPSEVMMVGDSAADDVVCGNRAGALTCLLDETQRHRLSELPSEQQPTFVIKTLFEINSILENFELLPVTDEDNSSISDDVSAFRVQEAS